MSTDLLAQTATALHVALRYATDDPAIRDVSPGDRAAELQGCRIALADAVAVLHPDEAPQPFPEHDADACAVCRSGKGQSKDGSRCRFGEAHNWSMGVYVVTPGAGASRTWDDAHVHCVRCGRVEWDG
jgi:hypothetical protein